MDEPAGQGVGQQGAGGGRQQGVKERERAGRHGHGGADPHAWQSVANAKVYVANIRDALVAADPVARRCAYEANAAAYLGKLDALDADVKATVAAILADRRKIISTHDAFGYFQQAYGVEFVAPQGVSTRPSPPPATSRASPR